MNFKTIFPPECYCKETLFVYVLSSEREYNMNAKNINKQQKLVEGEENLLKRVLDDLGRKRSVEIRGRVWCIMEVVNENGNESFMGEPGNNETFMEDPGSNESFMEKSRCHFLATNTLVPGCLYGGPERKPSCTNYDDLRNLYRI
jgi:hypothetical protein